MRLPIARPALRGSAFARWALRLPSITSAVPRRPRIARTTALALALVAVAGISVAPTAAEGLGAARDFLELVAERIHEPARAEGPVRQGVLAAVGVPRAPGGGVYGMPNVSEGVTESAGVVSRMPMDSSGDPNAVLLVILLAAANVLALAPRTPRPRRRLQPVWDRFEARPGR